MYSYLKIIFFSVCVCVCVCVCVYMFVCLFAHVVQSWLTTVGPDGLDSPRSPFSTPKGDWDLYFLKQDMWRNGINKHRPKRVCV